MSHVAIGKLKIYDLASLIAACKQLGLEFCEGQSTWRWYGKWVKDYSKDDAAFKHGVKPEDYGKNAAHAIKVPGATYDIGVYKMTDAEGKTYYAPVHDNYREGHGIEKVCGKGLSKLQDECGVARALKWAKRQGMAASRIVKDGRVQVRARG